MSIANPQANCTRCDTADKAISALKRLNRSSEDMLNDILVYFVAQKLDSATRRAWKLRQSDETQPPTYEEIARFISNRAIALDEITPSTASKQNKSTKCTSANATVAATITCPLCKRNHFINKCHQFIEKSPSQRRELMKQFNRCFNCLSRNHSVSECNSTYTCRYCQRKHHSMLHVDSTPNSNAHLATDHANDSTISAEPATVSSLSIVPTTAIPTPVLLATARVIVSSPAGRELSVRALLDQRSEVSFITERIAQLLRLPRVRSNTQISAVGGVQAGVCRHAAHISIVSRHRSGPTFNTVAFILNSLTKYASRQSFFNT